MDIAMSMPGDSGDYWTGPTSGPQADPDFRIQVETCREIAPLDSQFGADMPKKTVPESLSGPLFGQPDPDAALHTYMILDAAKVQGLAELLEASGLEHRCLFKGLAYDDLKDVAPWIVRLESGNGFTRQVFTRSDAPWHLWDREPGIFLRSYERIDELWRHFRKFTRVRDQSGKWYYWRFWEGGFLLPTLEAATPTEQQKLFLDGRISSFHVISAGRQPRLTTLKPPQ